MTWESVMIYFFFYRRYIYVFWEPKCQPPEPPCVDTQEPWVLVSLSYSYRKAAGVTAVLTSVWWVKVARRLLYWRTGLITEAHSSTSPEDSSDTQGVAITILQTLRREPPSRRALAIWNRVIWSLLLLFLYSLCWMCQWFPPTSGKRYEMIPVVLNYISYNYSICLFKWPGQKLPAWTLTVTASTWYLYHGQEYWLQWWFKKSWDIWTLGS